MDRLLLALGVIFASLAAGYACRRMAEARAERALERWRRGLQLFALFGCIPLSAMLSLWGLPRPDPRLLVLPLLGLAAWASGGLLALAAARLLRCGRAQAGSLYCCGTFTNIGAVGTLVCTLYLGESAIALAALYRLCEEMFYFGIALPLARRFGDGGSRGALSAPLKSPMLLMALAALALGVALNLCGVARPEPLGMAAAALVVASTAMLLFSIGLGLRISRLACYKKESLAVCGIKFCCVPLVIVGLAHAAGLGCPEHALALRTVAVLSAMPVAMNALIPPSLFRLDLDLANACWIFSTAALVIVLPALRLLLPLL